MSNLKGDPRIAELANGLKAVGHDFLIIVVEPGKNSERTRVSVNDYGSWNRFKDAFAKAWRQSQGARKDLANRLKHLQEEVNFATAGDSGTKPLKAPWIKLLYKAGSIARSLEPLDGRTGEVKEMQATLRAISDKIYDRLDLHD